MHFSSKNAQLLNFISMLNVVMLSAIMLNVKSFIVLAHGYLNLPFPNDGDYKSRIWIIPVFPN
jgi:hypothetical protein